MLLKMHLMKMKLFIHFLDYSRHSLSSGSSSKAAAYVYLRVKGSAVQEYGVGVHQILQQQQLKQSFQL